MDWQFNDSVNLRCHWIGSEVSTMVYTKETLTERHLCEGFFVMAELIL